MSADVEQINGREGAGSDLVKTVLFILACVLAVSLRIVSVVWRFVLIRPTLSYHRKSLKNDDENFG